MTHGLASLTIWAAAATALGGTNLISDPGCEADADRDASPDYWQAAGDSRLVTQALGFGTGRDAKRCLRLACTRFSPGNPAAHAMLCQKAVPVRRGRAYRVSLWARAEGLAAEIVSLALSDTATWSNCGLEDAFAPSAEWQRYEFVFRATRDCSMKSRFQIWFTSTGTLWVDDVCLEEVEGLLHRPGHVLPAEGHANLVPNASFECGIDGWGSAEADRVTHWGGRLNRLVGALDAEEAFHGRHSLRIELKPESQPVSYFDWYHLHREPIRAPLAGNLGYLEVTPGRPYVLSVSMKAADEETPARLAVRQFMGPGFEKAVRLCSEWRRYALRFQPTRPWCYVLAGPDLCRSHESPRPPERATVWLDAVQLEPAEAPGAFSARTTVELGLATERLGNVFGWDEPLRLHLRVANHDPEQARAARIELWLTDFFGEELWREAREETVPAADAVRRRVSLEPGPARRGFLRLHVKMAAGGSSHQRSIRLAVIPIHREADSRFGVNHAYSWPHLLELCRMAGLQWVRDWSLKWQQVEPEKGRFTFAETDDQIDRPLGHGLRVLALAPFPSSSWASTAPADTKAADDRSSEQARVAHAPRDLAEFETYVERTVGHYRDRLGWWQVFNEPLFTHYSLPRRHGYTATDYARLTKAFVRAARRADPQCRILAGIGYLSEGRIMEDFEEFFAAGALEAIDAVDIHYYPRLRRPEFLEGLLQKLGGVMEKYGKRRPIWLTEYGYYADDEPWALPMPHSGFNRPLSSERQQAEYAVRWATLAFANGVEKIFYHAGTCDGLNQDSLQGIFFEYAGRPHKIYAAQAVMSHLLTPDSVFVERLSLGEGVRGYLFRDGRRLVGVVWAPGGVQAGRIRLGDAGLQLWDIMGRPQNSREVVPGETPVYLLSDALSVDQFKAAVD